MIFFTDLVKYRQRKRLTFEEDVEFYLETNDADDGIDDDEQDDFEVESLNYSCEEELRSKSNLYVPVKLKLEFRI